MLMMNYHHDNENLRGSTPLHLPYRYLSKITPTTKYQETPPPPPPVGGTPLHLPYRYWSQIAGFQYHAIQIRSK